LAKKKQQVTAATRHLEKLGIPFQPFSYKYEENGGTRVACKSLDVAEAKMIKTLVMENQDKEPFIVLMHGDKEVSTKQLARQLESKSISPCDPKTANKHSGYLTGGTSPFGTRKELKVYIQQTILELDHIYINGGLRGFLVRIEPAYLKKLDHQVVNVAN
jgi:Cys-tRNA(Pro) deacylase